jgi:TRAP-type mannitol/chloroaromatic compound transport system permease large subunit
LPGGQLGFLIFVNIFVFFLAFFLDFFEIAFIVIRCWFRWPRRSTSTWFGSGCCYA